MARMDVVVGLRTEVHGYGVERYCLFPGILRTSRGFVAVLVTSVLSIPGMEESRLWEQVS